MATKAPKITFEVYIKHMMKKYPISTRYFVHYLKKHDLFDAFCYNMNHSGFNDSLFPTHPSQLMGWAFKQEQTPEGEEFWQRCVNKWVAEIDSITSNSLKIEAYKK